MEIRTLKAADLHPAEYNPRKAQDPTELMKQIGTGGCFQSLNQVAGINKKINGQSFYGLMQEELGGKTSYYKRLFGLEE